MVFSSAAIDVIWGSDTITDNVVKNWLYRLYVRNGWLDIGRKRPIPHESWMQVGVAIVSDLFIGSSDDGVDVTSRDLSGLIRVFEKGAAHRA